MRTLLVAALLVAVPLIALAPTAEAQPPPDQCLHFIPCCDTPLCIGERLEPCRDPISGYYYC